MNATLHNKQKNELILALNAAEGDLQIVLGNHDGMVLFSSVFYTPSRGAEVLTPALESTLSLMDLRATDIAGIAVVRGPGSFTGLRLTATTAAGLARAVSARQAGLDYMRCIAKECLPRCFSADKNSLLWTIVRARRDLVYAQAFLHGNGDPATFRPLTALSVLSVSNGEAAAYIMQQTTLYGASGILLAGSGVRENRDHFTAAFGATRTTFLNIIGPQPLTLFEEALAAEYGEADIEPLYVRVSDAETNLPQIAARLGLDPDAAVEKLHRLTHELPEEGQED